MLRKISLFLCLSVVIGAVISCDLLNSSQNEHHNPPATEIRSVECEDAKAFLGDGYDLFSPFPYMKGMALDMFEVRRSIGDAAFYNSLEFSHDTYELNQKLNFGVDVDIDINLFNMVNASSSITYKIMEGSHFSSNTVAIMAQLSYSHCEVFINSADIKPDLRTLFETEPGKFRETYGDGYVKKAQLGQRIYLLYLATMNKNSNYTEKEIAVALDLKVKDILDLNTGIIDREEINEILSHTTLRSVTGGTGEFVPGLIWDRETFNSVYAGFKAYVQDCMSSGDITRFSVLSKAYGSYEDFKYPAVDPTAQYNYMRQWIKLRSRIMVIQADTEPYLDKECDDALALIAGEIQKCKELKPDARAPEPAEFASIEEAWGERLGEKIYPLQFAGETCYYYISCKPEEYIHVVDELEKKKNRTCTYAEPLEGRTFPVAARNTIPVYQLEDPYSGLSTYITTEIENYNRIYKNYGYIVPGEGKVLAYVDLSSTSLIEDINNVPFKPIPTPEPTSTPTPIPTAEPPVSGSAKFTPGSGPVSFRLQDYYTREIKSIISIKVTVIGGGGGAAAGYNSATHNGDYCYYGTLYPGGGGGAGGCIIQLDILSGFDKDAPYKVVAGTGGACGKCAGYGSTQWGTNGERGGTSSFGSITATGGYGGEKMTGGKAGDPLNTNCTKNADGGDGTGYYGTCPSTIPSYSYGAGGDNCSGYGNGGARGGSSSAGRNGYVKIEWVVTF
ncbi:MAG: hypothetical protein JXB88_15780 [Spirochaetales bacterium]|nr:hypothetical protein [Spirochaetales bacterium]